MKSLITPVLVFFSFDYLIFTDKSQSSKAHSKTDRRISGELTIFLLSAVNILDGKVEFFIWQQHLTDSATFTVLQEDRSSISALVQDSTVYGKQHDSNNYRTVTDIQVNMTEI